MISCFDCHLSQDVERFVEQHNLAEGEENPIDLRIARAQAGATNLIWIMRKAKLHKKLREDGTRRGGIVKILHYHTPGMYFV